MEKEKINLFAKFTQWRIKHISNQQFVLILSILIGIIAGCASIILKNIVHHIQHFFNHVFHGEFNFMFLLLPTIGILLVLLFARFIIGDRIGHGIPRVLYAISQNNGIIKRHSMFSSMVASALTVGFGGSAGLEGPAVGTGAALGSNLGRILHLNYKQTVLLLACGSTAAIAAIFNTPIAAIVFSLEILMLDLTLASLVPLLLSSTTGILVSYIFLGQHTIWAFNQDAVFSMGELPIYVLLGLFTGLVSVYFSKIYIYIETAFDKIKTNVNRLLVGGLSLGILVFLFPPLYGEGYEVINHCITGETEFLNSISIFSSVGDSTFKIIFILLAVVLLKAFATSITFGAGGVGGIFAPSLFVGAISGLLFAYIANATGLVNINVSNYSLVGMSGLIAGVLHGPLTAIFLIADVTSGYGMLIPLMITSVTAYVTAKLFVKNSVYTFQLARRKQLMTHDKDKAVFIRMNVEELLETDFNTVNPDMKLRELVQVIADSKRNVFPVIDKEENLVGILTLNDVRNIMFRNDMYDTTYVHELMYEPETWVNFEDSVEEIARKIQSTGRFNVPVLKNGKYKGCVSRANVFSSYRKRLREVTADE